MKDRKEKEESCVYRYCPWILVYYARKEESQAGVLTERKARSKDEGHGSSPGWCKHKAKPLFLGKKGLKSEKLAGKNKKKTEYTKGADAAVAKYRKKLVPSPATPKSVKDIG